MIKAGILGSTGYTGAELVRLLHRHPQVELTFVDSRKYEERSFGNAYPNLRDIAGYVCESVEPEAVPPETDVVFCALPHRVSQQKVLPLLGAGFRVVDFSADFRLRHGPEYEQWYKTKHLDREVLKKAVYGLPEWNDQQLPGADLVANPGCFPTSALLPLLPLLRDGLITGADLVVDSKTGVSGSGRNPSDVNVFSQVNENVRAYNIGGHRHTPEIEQELSLEAKETIKVLFIPHLVPMDRGILSTIVMPAGELSASDVTDCYRKAYENRPFIRILPEGQLPETKAVRGSNYCDIGFVLEPRSEKLVVVAAIDNLLKGSSSQAVQNMNLMFGLPEAAGIEEAGIWP